MSFTFNGVNSDSMGLIVEQYPPRPFPSRKSEKFSIVGRSGDLYIEQDAWTNVTQEYKVFVNGNFQANMQAIAYWLLNADGYCELTDSYTPNVYRMAKFIGGASFLNALNRYGKATITFDCCPQRYISPEEELTGTIGDTFTFPTHTGAMKGLPLVSIPDLLLNTSLKIKTDTLTVTIPAQGSLIKSVFLDWETQVVGTTQPNKTLTLVSVSGTWEPLGDGDQIITTLESGTTSTVRVYPRRWYL